MQRHHALDLEVDARQAIAERLGRNARVPQRLQRAAQNLQGVEPAMMQFLENDVALLDARRPGRPALMSAGLVGRCHAFCLSTEPSVATAFIDGVPTGVGAHAPQERVRGDDYAFAAQAPLEGSGANR